MASVTISLKLPSLKLALPPLPKQRFAWPKLTRRAVRAVPKTPKKDGSWRSDLALGLSGAALGLTCAFFPWYIFMNQDQFGPPSVTFEGAVIPAPVGAMVATAGAPEPLTDAEEVPILELDLFRTGTVDAGDRDDEQDAKEVEAAAAQPYPDVPLDFRIVHVTAGRAMAQDDSGVWVVQRGTLLPDNSRVTSIEKRKGRWVVVTDGARVLTAAN